MASKKIQVELDPDQIVQVTSNHGGYKGGECLVCGASGWLSGRYGLRSTSPDAKEWRGTHLVHKIGCPMNKLASKRRDA